MLCRVSVLFRDFWDVFTYSPLCLDVDISWSSVQYRCVTVRTSPTECKYTTISLSLIHI